MVESARRARDRRLYRRRSALRRNRLLGWSRRHRCALAFLQRFRPTASLTRGRSRLALRQRWWLSASTAPSASRARTTTLFSGSAVPVPVTVICAGSTTWSCAGAVMTMAGCAAAGWRVDHVNCALRQDRTVCRGWSRRHRCGQACRRARLQPALPTTVQNRLALRWQW